MKPGSKWPIHLVVDGKMPKETIKKKEKPDMTGGKPPVSVPSFKNQSTLKEMDERYSEVVTNKKSFANKNLMKYLEENKGKIDVDNLLNTGDVEKDK
jgi:hypothetical protein